MTSDISIYVPAFNAENTIDKCLNSIFKQTVYPAQILVINDCSTDSTYKILEKYNKKIKVINNKENLGLSCSMNIANKNLNTRYIAKIDADVELETDWLEKNLNKLRSKSNDITLIGGKMYEKYIDNPYNLWRSKRLKQHWGEKDILNPILIFGCNNIVDTQNIDMKDIYRTDHEYYKTNGEDIEFCKLLRKKKLNIYYYSDAICHHLQNDSGKTLANRYYRWMLWGDGLKKRNLLKTLKNCLRQLRKTIKWCLEDLIQLDFKLIKVNMILFFYYVIIDFKSYKDNKND
jgi:glycosyltransferase involved in cell wall biosynthesis